MHVEFGGVAEVFPHPEETHAGESEGEESGRVGTVRRTKVSGSWKEIREKNVSGGGKKLEQIQYKKNVSKVGKCDKFTLKFFSPPFV